MPDFFNKWKDEVTDALLGRGADSSGIPRTQTRTSHSLIIRAGYKNIGRIQSWVPSQSRTITPIYEINAATEGQVFENVPGVATGLTIQVTRFDLYSSRLEEVFGPSSPILMLTDQHNPFTITEKWVNPNGTLEYYSYRGCWFTNLGRNISVQGDRIVNVNASLVYQNIIRTA